MSWQPTTHPHTYMHACTHPHPQIHILKHHPLRPLPPRKNQCCEKSKKWGMKSSAFCFQSFRTRSEQSTPITPPHPPKRPRTNRMLSRRANSLTTPEKDRVQMEQAAHPARMTNSAGQERKKERIEVTSCVLVTFVSVVKALSACIWQGTAY